jgi:hypothetical protein
MSERQALRQKAGVVLAGAMARVAAWEYWRHFELELAFAAQGELNVWVDFEEKRVPEAERPCP